MFRNRPGVLLPWLLAWVVCSCSPGAVYFAGEGENGNKGDQDVVPFAVDTYPSLVNTTTVAITGTKANGDGVWVDASEAVAPDSATTWSTDLGLNKGDRQYVFEVQPVDPAGDLGAAIELTIVLESQPPVIASRSPTPSASGIALNTVVEVGFDELVCDGVDASSLTLRAQGASSDVAAAVACEATTATITLTPSANLAPNTPHTVTVHPGVADVLGNATPSADTWQFTTGASVDNDPPLPPMVSPPAPATTLQASITLEGSKEAGASVMVGTVDDPAQMSTAVAKDATATWQHTFDLAVGDNTFYLRSEDGAGNVSTSSTTVTIERLPPDTTAPTISARTPAPDATGVAVDAQVEVTLSEPIDCATVTHSSFSIAGQSSVVSCNGSVATLTPTSDLAEATVFDVTVTTAVSDLAGNPLAAEDTWSFTTGDFTPPGPPTFSTPATPTYDATVLVTGGRDDKAAVEFRWKVDGALQQDWTEIVGALPGTTWLRTFDLNLGDNLIELRSKDGGGNLSNLVSFNVVRDPVLVAAPTVDPVVSPTSVGNQVLSGTKPANTSVRNHGVEIVPQDSDTTWSALVILSAGSNDFELTAHDGTNTSPTVPVSITYTSNGTASAGQIQVDLELRDLAPLIAGEMGLGDPNHYSVEIWVEGPLTFSGTGPYTYENCLYNDDRYERQHVRYVAGIVRSGGSGCLGTNDTEPERCWWWGEPDYFNPNHLAALVESGLWASANNPLPPLNPAYTRRQGDGSSWGWSTAPVDGHGCNAYHWFHSTWCRPRMWQGPNTDGVTEASRRAGSNSYTWDLIDHTGAPVELGPYLIQIVVNVDRDEDIAVLTDVETCWDRAGHDTIGSHRAEGIIMVDGANPTTATWNEKGYIDTVAGGAAVEYLVGPVTVRYCPTGPVTGACP